MEKKQIVKAIKEGDKYYVQFKINFDARRNNYLQEKGRTMYFNSADEAMKYAGTVFPSWMFN